MEKERGHGCRGWEGRPRGGRRGAGGQKNNLFARDAEAGLSLNLRTYMRANGSHSVHVCLFLCVCVCVCF